MHDEFICLWTNFMEQNIVTWFIYVLFVYVLHAWANHSFIVKKETKQNTQNKSFFKSFSKRNA